MAVKYYNNNTIDTSSTDLLTGDLLVKVTKQEIDSKVYEGVFGIFTRNVLDAGFQWEEIEVGNLTSSAFDATGANAMTKATMHFKSLFHKLNRERTFQATVSDAQVKRAMLSVANMASLASAITSELYNSSAIEDYEAMKDLLNDIIAEKKVMTICDLNGNGADIDAVTKAIQVVASNMTFPSSEYNFSGFKKAFNKKEDLVLIIGSGLQAQLNVDSLATAFNMEKKALVEHIIVVDALPTITYSSLATKEGSTLDIGETNGIVLHKYLATGTDSVSGTAMAILCDRKAIIRDPVERELTEQYNAKGRFTNYFLHANDVLSYSTLKNAVVFVD